MKHVLYFSWALPEGYETCPVFQLSSTRRIWNMYCISVGFYQKYMEHVLYLSWVLPEVYETCPLSQLGSTRRKWNMSCISVGFYRKDMKHALTSVELYQKDTKHVLHLIWVLREGYETFPLFQLGSNISVWKMCASQLGYTRRILNIFSIWVEFYQKDMKHVLYLSWVLPEGYETCPLSQLGSTRRIWNMSFISIGFCQKDMKHVLSQLGSTRSIWNMSFISVGFCQKDMKHVLRHSSVLSEVGFRHLEIHIILLRYVLCVCVCVCVIILVGYIWT